MFLLKACSLGYHTGSYPAVFLVFFLKACSLGYHTGSYPAVFLVFSFFLRLVRLVTIQVATQLFSLCFFKGLFAWLPYR